MMIFFRLVVCTLIRLIVCTAIFSSCDEEDPCAGRPARTADFVTYTTQDFFERIKEQNFRRTEVLQEDTFMVGRYITFEALDSTADTYEWKIGSDPRVRTERSVTLYFQNNSAIVDESPLTVQLKVTRQPDKCYADPFIDSVRHKISFLPFEKWPLFGKYTGYDNTNPSEIYTVEILSAKTIIYPAMTAVIRNLPNNCNNKDALLSDVTAFTFAIDMFDYPDIGTNHQCVFRSYDKKVGRLLPDRKTIVIGYGFTDHKEQDASLQTRTFIGTRQ